MARILTVQRGKRTVVLNRHAYRYDPRILWRLVFDMWLPTGRRQITREFGSRDEAYSVLADAEGLEVRSRRSLLSPADVGDSRRGHADPKISTRGYRRSFGPPQGRCAKGLLFAARTPSVNSSAYRAIKWGEQTRCAAQEGCGSWRVRAQRPYRDHGRQEAPRTLLRRTPAGTICCANTDSHR